MTPFNPFESTIPNVPDVGRGLDDIGRFFSYIGVYYTDHPVTGMGLLTLITTATAVIALGMSLPPYPIHRARPLAWGFAHTALWSLAVTLYLALPPGTGVPQDFGPWIVLTLAAVPAWLYSRRVLEADLARVIMGPDHD